MITIQRNKINLFLAVLFSAIMLSFACDVRADDCSVCSAASRSDSLLGMGGIEYLIEQQQENVSPFNAELRIGGLYDSRVGSSTGSEEEDSDTALTARLALGWQAPMMGNFGVRLDYRGYADFHQDYDEYNMIDQSISIEPLYKAGQFIFSLPLSFNLALQDGDHDYNRYAVSPTLTYLIPNTTQALAVYGIAAKIEDKDDDEKIAGMEWYDDDGKTYGGGLAYLYYFANKSRLRLSLDYQHSEYDSLVWQYQITSDYEEERDSNAIVASLDMLSQLTDHFGLYLNYAFIHSTSNVDIYEYNRHLVEGGLALKF